MLRRLEKLAATRSPVVQDAREYRIIHSTFSPECRWLLATGVAVPALDRLLSLIGLNKARVTIPKWLQRGLLDHLDSITSIVVDGSMRLTLRDDGVRNDDGDDDGAEEKDSRQRRRKPGDREEQFRTPKPKFSLPPDE